VRCLFSRVWALASSLASPTMTPAIATYSQAGTQFGLNTLWTIPLCYPLMGAVQSLCARIGPVTGHGLAFNLKRVFPLWVVYASVALLLTANILNSAADIAAMGDVLAGSIAANQLSLDASTATVVVGIFGTTISPYLFFWQSSEEVADMRAQNFQPLHVDHAAAASELLRICRDTWTGMLFSNVDPRTHFVALPNVLTGGATPLPPVLSPFQRGFSAGLRSGYAQTPQKLESTDPWQPSAANASLR
jgi:Mn2+/Fe2+ NRAMP family transporter